jgi:hypothetical protein
MTQNLTAFTSPFEIIFSLNRENSFRETGRVRYILLVEATASQCKALTTGIPVGDGVTPAIFYQSLPNGFFSTTTYHNQYVTHGLSRLFQHDNFMLCSDCDITASNAL